MGRRLDEKDYLLTKMQGGTPVLPLGRLKRYRSMQPKSLEECEADSERRLKRREKANEWKVLRTPVDTFHPQYSSRPFYVEDTQKRLDFLEDDGVNSNSDSSSSVTVPDTPPSLRQRLLTKLRNTPDVTASPADYSFQQRNLSGTVHTPLQALPANVPDRSSVNNSSTTGNVSAKACVPNCFIENVNNCIEEKMCCRPVGTGYSTSDVVHLPIQPTAAQQSLSGITTSICNPVKPSSVSPEFSVLPPVVRKSQLAQFSKENLPVENDKIRRKLGYSRHRPSEIKVNSLSFSFAGVKSTTHRQSMAPTDESERVMHGNQQFHAVQTDDAKMPLCVPSARRMNPAGEPNVIFSSELSEWQQKSSELCASSPVRLLSTELSKSRHKSSIMLSVSTEQQTVGRKSATKRVRSCSPVSDEQQICRANKVQKLTRDVSGSLNISACVTLLPVSQNVLPQPAHAPENKKIPSELKPLRQTSIQDLFKQSSGKQQEMSLNIKTADPSPSKLPTVAYNHKHISATCVSSITGVSPSISSPRLNAKPTENDSMEVECPDSLVRETCYHDRKKAIEYLASGSPVPFHLGKSHIDSTDDEAIVGGDCETQRPVVTKTQPVRVLRLPAAWEKVGQKASKAASIKDLEQDSSSIAVNVNKLSNIEEAVCLNRNGLKALDKTSSACVGYKLSGCREKLSGDGQHSNADALLMTSLHRGEQELVRSAVEKLGRFTIVNRVQNGMTNIVCGCNRRTVKILMGIAHGCWIVSVNWVIESVAAGRWLDEANYELSVFFPAASLSRNAFIACGRASYKPSLFNSVGNIYIAESSAPPYKELKQLIVQCGGQVTTCRRKGRICVGTFSKAALASVSEQWVLDSITKLSSLPVDDYLLPSS